MLYLKSTCVHLFFAWLFSRRALKHNLEERRFLFLRKCARLQSDEVSSDPRAKGGTAGAAMCDESFEWAMMAFTTIDEDGDQEISGGELGKAHALIMKCGNGMADLAHGGSMEGIDTNHDGKIDVDEWLAYMAAVEQTIGSRELVRSCKLFVDVFNRCHEETGARVSPAGRVKDATVDELTACSAKLSSEEGIFLYLALWQ